MTTIQQSIWQSRILLEIRLSASESRLYDHSAPYAVTVPRLSYLPFFLPKLLKFYQEDVIADIETLNAYEGQFSYEGVPLKWHLPIGLLYDIYVLTVQDVVSNEKEVLVGSEDNVRPFRLTVSFSPRDREDKHLLISPDPAIVHDSFINSVKEADFVRSGTAKPIMSLSATESKLLWTAVQEHNLDIFAPIYRKLLPDNKPWRNIPLRIFLPSVPSTDEEVVGENADTNKTATTPQGSIRVIQTQISPYVLSAATGASQLRAQSAGQGSRQTLGTALHSILPTLFPSRRTPILAKPLLHGAALPMNAVLEEVASQAAYADGWVNVVVAVNG